MRLRDITPKSLFGRMLAIILVPIILVQIISVSIFYERHWDWVSRHMAKNLSKDLGLLIDELGKEPSKEESEKGYKNFTVIQNKIIEIDWLYLEASGHRRLKITFKENIKNFEWLIP